MRVRLAPLLLCALSFIPLGASAQTDTSSTGVTVEILEFGDRSSVSVSSQPLSIDECEADIGITFRISGLPTTEPVLAVYSGTNCQTANARLGTNGSSMTCEEVTHMDVTNASSSRVEITINATLLGCEGEVFEDLTLFFMRLPSATSGEDATAWGVIEIPIDTKAPPAPTEVSDDGEGESAIPVDWTFEGTDVNRFYVCWDPASEGCASSVLVAGADVDPSNPAIECDTATASQRSTTLSGAAAIGQEVAVAVIAEDLAKNRSVLSNIGCVTGVETTGWLDLHKAQGGETGNTCSVAAMNRGHLWTLAVWAMLIAVLALRATRRVS
jgi:hypothetical protein